MPDALSRRKVNSSRRKKYNIEKLLKTSWRYQTREFFENSTLHGVRYIAERDRPLYENFMWFVFVLLSTIVTFVIIVSLWEKFQTTPTITGLDTDFHNWDVPFPGITVCTLRPVSPGRVSEYVTKRWGDSLSEEKADYYGQFVTLIANLSYDNLHEVAAYKDDKSLPQDNFRNLTYEVVNHCEDTLYDCKWKGEALNCCLSFHPAFTEKGFCYSFNSLKSEAIWPWKEDNEPVEKTTSYIFETDTKWSLQFDGFANATENPYNIYIHNSDELPIVEMPPQHGWDRNINKVFFAPKTTYTTEDARQLSAKQRHCIFEDEVKLKTFPKYSYSACMSDCRMRFTLQACGCVPHFYHDVAGFPYCNLQGLACLSKRSDKWKKGLQCPCELGCMNTVYEVEKLNNANEVDDPIEIGFVSWPMIRYKREVLFGWVDLLVAFGGIAGLFLGFSLLSGVEIIYYFTMRACCMVYRDPDVLTKYRDEAENETYADVDLSLKVERKKQKPPKVPERFQIKKDYMYVPFLN